MDIFALWQKESEVREERLRTSLKCFVKVSGDMFLEEAFLRWVTALAKGAHVVVSIGGGTQINRALEEKGFKSEKHPRLGRKTCWEGYKMAYEVLRDNRAKLSREFKSRGVMIYIVLPVLKIQALECHVDGDLMIYNAYWGFDELYVVTTPDRVETKRALFSDLPKVCIVSL